MSQPNHQTPIPEHVQKIAQKMGLILDDAQLHIGGERSILSPNKLVLTGKANTGSKVILKFSAHPDGRAEIYNEHSIRTKLLKIPFAEQTLLMPIESHFDSNSFSTTSVTEFIEQPRVFTDFSLKEQFFMAINALETQESFHATTREHRGWVQDIFPKHSPEFYIESFAQMSKAITAIHPESTAALDAAYAELKTHKPLLQSYDGYLIHSDFVPHNFRINDNQLFLLDFVSYRIGNKYEMWARFINFMEIHSPALVPLLLDFVKQDRGAEEYAVLRYMRMYKICFLLFYYSNSLKKTDGDLYQLTEARLQFWTTVLESVVADISVPDQALQTYYSQRASLRTAKEKERQRQFTWSD